MLRKIITIDEEKCSGCGLCARACHEGAIGMVHGKAKLLRDDYCDGLGDCLPACPTGAISFEEREALAYDEAAVAARKAANTAASLPGADRMAEETLACGCPGTAAKAIRREPVQAGFAAACSSAACSSVPVSGACQPKGTEDAGQPQPAVASQLSQWPVQIKLLAPNAPYFENADLLVAADCTAYAYGNFHQDFIKGRITAIGCPKLDAVDYSEKLGAILKERHVKSVTVTRMEVPCCGGIEQAVKKAVDGSGRKIPWKVVVISAEGEILREKNYE